MDRTFFFFFLFGWNKSQTWEIHQPTNLTRHFSHMNPKATPGQEENRTFFYNSALKFSILSITNDGSTQLNPFKPSMEDH